MLSCVYLARTIRTCCTVCDDLIVLSDEDKENVRPDEDAEPSYEEGRVLHLRYMYELNMDQRTRLIVREIMQGMLLLIYKSGLSSVCLSVYLARAFVSKAGTCSLLIITY